MSFLPLQIFCVCNRSVDSSKKRARANTRHQLPVTNHTQRCPPRRRLLRLASTAGTRPPRPSMLFVPLATPLVSTSLEPPRAQTLGGNTWGLPSMRRPRAGKTSVGGGAGRCSIEKLRVRVVGGLGLEEHLQRVQCAGMRGGGTKRRSERARGEREEARQKKAKTGQQAFRARGEERQLHAVKDS